jgi:hypothetical protein
VVAAAVHLHVPDGAAEGVVVVVEGGGEGGGWWWLVGCWKQ